MVKKIKRICDGTLVGFRAIFPEHEFKKSIKNNIVRKFKSSWRIVCNHNRQRANCRECGGSSFCEHNHYKPYCRDCKGSGFCKHDRLKANCRDCKGCGICKHDRRKRRCRDCKGSGICKHDRRKTNCRECKGSGVCKHDRQKAVCRECKGSSICTHNRRKVTCIKCNGSSICKTCNIRVKAKDGYCKRCHPDFIETGAGKSKVACKFIDALEIELGVKIQHFHADKATKTWVGSEHTPDNWKLKQVDGYISKDNLIYEDPTLEADRDYGKDMVVEFLGDIFHGHPTTWPKVTNHYGTDLKALFKNTEEKLAKLVSLGYVVFYVWENDYKKIKGLGSVAGLCRRFIDKLEY